jgi:Uncharacterized conserved protein, contains double-stranded beta-helix domain
MLKCKGDCHKGAIVQIRRFEADAGEKIDEPRQFSGPLGRQPLFVAGQDDSSTDVTGVVFPPGVRTLPHIHSVDQLLYGVDGAGVVGITGEVREVGAGDWILIPADTWHWHGAQDDVHFHQVAIKSGGSTEWLQAGGNFPGQVQSR